MELGKALAGGVRLFDSIATYPVQHRRPAPAKSAKDAATVHARYLRQLRLPQSRSGVTDHSGLSAS